MQSLKQLYFNTFNNRNKNANLQRLAKNTGVHIIFPFYHIVSNQSVPHIKHLYPVKDTIAFEDEMRFLTQHFTPLHIDDYVAGNYEKGKMYFVLSFDDGLSEMHSVVAPILKQMGIPATFFLNSDFIDNKGLFYRYKVAILIEKVATEELSKQITNSIGLGKVKIANPAKYLLQLKWSDTELIDNIALACNVSFNDYLAEFTPYLTTVQIQDLINEGHAIGAHSINHPEYRTIDPQIQFLQTRDSMQIIADNFGLKKKYFAFPFTADGVVKELFPAMYGELNIDLSFGTAGLQTTKYPKHIERIPAEHLRYGLQEIIGNEYYYYRFKRRLGK